MPAIKRLTSSIWTVGALLLSLAVIAATLAPLLGLIGEQRYWPGFFYAPFYTNNLFTDPTAPAARAGLQPEDRVILVNRERIEQLTAFTVLAGANGGSLSLVYELGRDLATIEVPVEQMGWERLLEKWGPLLLAGLGLVALGCYRREGSTLLAGLALVTACDYWLNPGAGRESGFDPLSWLAAGRWFMTPAKWSTYLYWPLWSLAVAALGARLAGQLWAGRRLRLAYLSIAGLTLAELIAGSYEAGKSAYYNNPDYLTWHSRLAFWPHWLIILLLAAALVWQSRREWPGWLGLAIFVVGFMGPTVFNSAWPGPGPQWYAWGLLAFNARSKVSTRR